MSFGLLLGGATAFGIGTMQMVSAMSWRSQVEPAMQVLLNQQATTEQRERALVVIFRAARNATEAIRMVRETQPDLADEAVEALARIAEETK